jgi:chemotaxis protein MotB
MKKKAPEAEKENNERWTLTYLDMITLLFVFFVVMYAMSKVDVEKFEALAGSLNSAFSASSEEPGSGTGSGLGEGKIITEKNQTKPEVPMQSNAARSRVYDKAYDIIKSYKAQDKVKVRQEQRGVVVQLGAELFFAPGKADLPANAGQALLSVAMIANSLPNEIQIEGHTDPTPPDAAEGFRNNWELSSQRAINVLELLETLGVKPERMSAAAFGDTRPLASNDTAEGRSYNRRIDVVFLYDPSEIK